MKQKIIIICELIILLTIVIGLITKFNPKSPKDSSGPQETTVVLAPEKEYRYVGDSSSVDPVLDKLLDPANIQTTESFLYHRTGSTTPRYGASGYYTTYEVIKYSLDYDPSQDPYPGTTTCQGFKLTGSSKLVYDLAYTNMNNEKILNLDFTDISQENRQEIMYSSSSSPIALQLTLRELPKHDNSYCESLVDVVGIIKIPPPQQ